VQDQTISIQWKAEDGPSDAQLQFAKQAIRARYYRSIKAHAEGIVGRIKTGELEDEDQVERAVREDAEYSHWVIYTDGQYMALYASDADPWEEAVDMGMTIEAANGATTLAFIVVAHDMVDAIESQLGDNVHAYFKDKAEMEKGE
jgi:hypothetical protein